MTPTGALHDDVDTGADGAPPRTARTDTAWRDHGEEPETHHSASTGADPFNGPLALAGVSRAAQTRMHLDELALYIDAGDHGKNAQTLGQTQSRPQANDRSLRVTRSLEEIPERSFSPMAFTQRARSLDAIDLKVSPLLDTSPRDSVSTLPELARAVSSFLLTPIEQTFFCLICCENVAITQAYQLSACGHRFCQPCFQSYLEVKIRDGQVYPKCFHEVSTTNYASDRLACGVSISESDIEHIVPKEVWDKYLRFKFNKEHEYGRQCPYCSHSQTCVGPKAPECICEACGAVFCYMHGNAHIGDTCADFELKQMETEKMSRSVIAQYTRSCPGCKSSVEKNGGCNHMTCIVCFTNFCWLCGKKIGHTATPNHYAWWNFAGCAGQQMIELGGHPRSEKILRVFCTMFFLVLCVPLALVLTVVMTLLSGCCLPCKFCVREDPKEMFESAVDSLATWMLIGVVWVILFLISCSRTVATTIKSLVCRLIKSTHKGNRPDAVPTSDNRDTPYHAADGVV